MYTGNYITVVYLHSYVMPHAPPKKATAPPSVTKLCIDMCTTPVLVVCRLGRRGGGGGGGEVGQVQSIT